MRSPARASAAGLVPVLVLTALALTGCVAAADRAPTVAPTPSATPTPTPTATPDPAPTPTPSPTAMPLSIPCTELVPTAKLTGMFAGYQPITGYAPAAGTLGAQVHAAQGTVCGWQNSQNQVLMAAVAQLDPASLLAKKNELVMTSNSVPTYGVEGYFQVTGGVGQAEAFEDPYWLVATSVVFLEPGEPQPIIAAMLETLRARG